MWRAALITKAETLSIPIVVGMLCLLVSTSSVIAYYKHTSTHLPPNIYINNIYVGNVTYEEALQQLQDQSPTPSSYPVVLSVEGITIASDSATLGLHYHYQATLAHLKEQATQGRMRDKVMWRVRPLFSTKRYEVPLSYAEENVDSFISELNSKVSYQGEDPYAKLSVSQNANSITIFPGKSGRTIDTSLTKKLLDEAIGSQTASIAAIVASTSGQLTPEEVTAAEVRSKKIVGKSINFSFDNRDYSISDTALVSFLNLPSGYDLDLIQTEIATLAAKLDRPAQEPVLQYDKETLAVTKFSPPLDGQTLNRTTTQTQILEALKKLEQAPSEESKNEDAQTIELVVATTPPQKSLAETNELGIKQLIGFGDSHYDHSIPNRIHNVAITTERISDVIVPPGGEFQFNKVLGDVSAETGYRSAYVIKNGQTELGDGGGVCQVSTTLFRSVLDAGLKVTRRIPHSYRVSYYELDSKPGVDATVYAGETDFRFINDTPGHILIHAEADSKNLYMFVNIYGTSDGRTTQLKDHITWNPRPAPAPQYFPDPTLPAGKLVQIDWAASGISASFINVIKDKDGKVIREDKYVSNYKPWAAKYRQGTGT